MTPPPKSQASGGYWPFTRYKGTCSASLSTWSQRIRVCRWVGTHIGGAPQPSGSLPCSCAGLASRDHMKHWCRSKLSGLSLKIAWTDNSRGLLLHRLDRLDAPLRSLGTYCGTSYQPPQLVTGPVAESVNVLDVSFRACGPAQTRRNNFPDCTYIHTYKTCQTNTIACAIMFRFRRHIPTHCEKAHRSPERKKKLFLSLFPGQGDRDFHSSECESEDPRIPLHRRKPTAHGCFASL